MTAKVTVTRQKEKVLESFIGNICHFYFAIFTFYFYLLP